MNRQDQVYDEAGLVEIDLFFAKVVHQTKEAP